MESAESKQRDVIELINVTGDREVRLKLREQLRGLVAQIDVDLKMQRSSSFCMLVKYQYSQGWYMRMVNQPLWRTMSGESYSNRLRGLVARIAVNLVKKQMVVFYIGQRPRMRPISLSQ